MNHKVFDIKKFTRNNVAEMSPYASAREEFVDKAEVYIDANENPFETGINRYPDPIQTSVKKAISKIKMVPVENMLLGNGSDEVLDLIFRAFCEPRKDNVIHTPPTFGMFKVLARLNDIELKDSILSLKFDLNTEDILKKVDENTKVIFLCSPNNPTGNIMPLNHVEEILVRSGCLVVIDEAYIDFSAEISWTSRLEKYPNLIVCQTLSKAWGLAGIRLGMCYASKEIISVLNKIKLPYNVNILTQNKVLESLQNYKDYELKLEAILTEREILRKGLNQLHFVEKIYPTEANFWLVKVDNANKRYQQLIERGIVVRNRSNQVLCENCLRITVGTRKENEKLIHELVAIGNCSG